MKYMLLLAVSLTLVGCGIDSTDTTDYNKPYNGTQSSNDAFRDTSVKSIVQDRANERASQSR